jgi:hypothetical protein
MVDEAADVAEIGRVMVAADPVGVMFGLRQAGTQAGVDLVGEPGAVDWVADLGSPGRKSNT